VAIIGLILYFSGYIQGLFATQVGGAVLTASMFAVYMVKKLKRR
jgi:cytochrome c oxidase assembly factor CtaG